MTCTATRVALVTVTATGTFSDDTSQDVTAQVGWTSSDLSIATIDATGRITARSVGSATISGSLQGRSVSVTVGVTGATLVAVQVTPDLPSVPAGVQVTFTLTGIFSDQTTRDLTSDITWTVADPSIATLSASGVASGVKPGTTAVTATVGGVSDSTTLTVTPATLASIDVLPPESSIASGTEAFLQAMATYSDGSVVDVTAQAFWASDSAAVAVSVDARGAVVKGLAVGTANVTATFGTATPDTATVAVTAARLRSLALSPTSATTPIGLTQQLVATGTFSDQSSQDLSSEATWTSSDPAVASVSTTGIVTGLQAGSATITATSLGMTATANVTVTAVTLLGVTVKPTAAKLPVGYKVQFVATAQFNDGSSHDVTSQALWSSSSSAVTISNASNSKGLATGVAAGTAIVKATLGAFSATASVEVTVAQLSSIMVSPAEFTVGAKTTYQLAAIGTFDDQSTLDLTRQCSWKSSVKRTARVSQSGLVTGAKRGTVTITATKAGLSGQAAGTVN